MNTHELAWAAGFFDGEGHVGFTRTKRHDLYLHISQIDRFVLDRFHAAVGGLGKVGGPFVRERKNESAVYYYQTARHEYIQAIIAMMWAWLSPVKRRQATDALLSFRYKRVGLRHAKQWTACRRGHPRTPENMRIVIYKGYETRRCVACIRERGVRFQRQAQMAAALLEA